MASPLIQTQAKRSPITSAPKAPIKSLLEIMKEQAVDNDYLAQKVVQEQQDEDADLKLALAISLLDQDSGETEAERVFRLAQQDADYALALQMQDDAALEALRLQRLNSANVQMVSKDSLDTNVHSVLSSVSDDEDDGPAYYSMNSHQNAHLGVGSTSRINKHDADFTSRVLTTNISGLPHGGDMSKTSTRISNKVYNELHKHTRKSVKAQIRVKGKEDIAKEQGVMDNETSVSLLYLMNLGFLDEMYGAISEGKEGIVYCGTGHRLLKIDTNEEEEADVTEEANGSLGDGDTEEEGSDLDVDSDGEESAEEGAVRLPSVDSSKFEEMQLPVAIKIFKLCAESPARLKYIEGDRRFMHRLKQARGKRIAKLWAEKEMRNFKRMRRLGIPCPEPLCLRGSILITALIGTDGSPAPQLRVASLSDDEYLNCYSQVVKMMTDLYQKARLVHTDLSEYNILVEREGVEQKPQCYFIDVSQALDSSHELADSFLWADCGHVLDFFKCKRLSGMMSQQALYDTVRGKYEE